MFTVAKSYSFGDYILTIGGLPIGGYGEDGGVTFEPLTPERTTTMVGADGEVTATQTKDKRVRMTVRLMETSRSNSTLASFQKAQELAKGPLKTASYFVPVAGVDANTGETVISAQCIFEGPPTVTKDQNPSNREWSAILPAPVLTFATL